MHKQTSLYVIAGLLIVAVVGVIYFSSRGTAATTPTTYAKAKATPATAKCQDEASSLKLPSGARNDIELSAISYLTDVPAGTNVDVKLASYSADKVTGSDRYPEKYGNYNFTLQKQNGSWAVTGFNRCY